MTCRWCGQSATWDVNVGFIHANGFLADVVGGDASPRPAGWRRFVVQGHPFEDRAVWAL